MLPGSGRKNAMMEYMFRSYWCSTGSGAHTGCTSFGGAVTDACNPAGNMPNHTATMCAREGTTNRSVCSTGVSPSVCYSGGGRTTSYCRNGNENSNVCSSGNGQPGLFSS